MKKLLLSTLLLSVIAFSGNAQQTMDYLDTSSSGALYKKQCAQTKRFKNRRIKYLVDDF
jgi:hypothetical protein